MKFINKIKELYLRFRVMNEPSFINKIENPSSDLLYKILRANPSVYMYMDKPSFHAANITLIFEPKYLNKNKNLSMADKVKLINHNVNALKYLDNFPLKESVGAILNNPSILKGIRLDAVQKEQLYSLEPRLIKYIPEPHPHLQKLAVDADWKNIYLFKEPSESALKSIFSQLGVHENSFTSENNKALVTMLDVWKEAESDHNPHVVSYDEINYFFDQGISFLEEAVADDLFFERYKASIMNFKFSTGFEIAADSKIFSDTRSACPWLRKEALNSGVVEVPDSEISMDTLYKSVKQKTFKRLLEEKGKEMETAIQKTLESAGFKMDVLSEKDIEDLKQGKNVKLPDGNEIYMKSCVGSVTFNIHNRSGNYKQPSENEI